MKGVKMNYNKHSWEEIEVPDGAAIQTDPPVKIFRCAGCGKRMSGGHTSLFLKNMNFVGFKVCDECNVRLWDEDSEGYEDEVVEEREKKKAIQCMYCGAYSSNTNHVCDECEALGMELSKKLEGKWKVSKEGIKFIDLKDLISEEELNEGLKDLDEKFMKKQREEGVTNNEE